jgi:hypothetical protein
MFQNNGANAIDATHNQNECLEKSTTLLQSMLSTEYEMRCVADAITTTSKQVRVWI